MSGSSVLTESEKHEIQELLKASDEVLGSSSIVLDANPLAKSAVATAVGGTVGNAMMTSSVAGAGALAVGSGWILVPLAIPAAVATFFIGKFIGKSRKERKQAEEMEECKKYYMEMAEKRKELYERYEKQKKKGKASNQDKVTEIKLTIKALDTKMDEMHEKMPLQPKTANPIEAVDEILNR